MSSKDRSWRSSVGNLTQTYLPEHRVESPRYPHLTPKALAIQRLIVRCHQFNRNGYLSGCVASVPLVGEPDSRDVPHQLVPQ